MIRDVDIRHYLRDNTWLQTGHDFFDVAIFEEFGVLNGAVRADVVVVNGRLCAFEIKSDVDNLKRLPEQIRGYSEVFDRVSIITTAKHIGEVKEIVPEWWGIYVATTDQSLLSIVNVRDSVENERVKADSVVRLLWQCEAVALANAYGANLPASARRRLAWNWLSSNCDLSDLRQKIRERLKLRQRAKLFDRDGQMMTSA